MKNLLPGVYALVFLCAVTSFAQDLTGTWQGVIHTANRDVREVIRIAKDDNVLKATLQMIDIAPGQTFPSSAVNLQGAAVKIQFPGIGATYIATMSTDDNSMTGTFAQEQPLALTLQRATTETAWEIPAARPTPKAMAADVDPVFVVATVKPTNPDTRGRGFMVQGRRFSTRNVSLSAMICWAYGIHPKQILGAPAWIENDKFDIAAEPDGDGQPSGPQWNVMLQKLLADRFQLAFHRDKRELSVYAITAPNTANRLTPSTGNPNGLPGLFFRGLGNLPARNATMTEFAQLLQSAVLDRPVIDRTGLKGRFDFTLDWAPDEFQFASLGARPAEASNDARPDLFTAFQRQLGLKLESTKATVETFIVDHTEKPSPN
jgi:uncharacterized protein (TIGR03435 family)